MGRLDHGFLLNPFSVMVFPRAIEARAAIHLSWSAEKRLYPRPFLVCHDISRMVVVALLPVPPMGCLCDASTFYAAVNLLTLVPGLAALVALIAAFRMTL